MKQPSHRRSHCLDKNGSRNKFREAILQKDTQAQKTMEEESCTLLNAIPQRAFMIDTRGTIIVANESLARSLVKSVNEVIDSSVCDLFPPDVVEHLTRHVDKSIRTSKPVHFEDMWQGRYCAHNVQPIFDTKGKVARVAISVTDITERKRAEEALQESERRYRVLAENSSDVIYLSDTNARLTYVSPSITGLLGYTVEEILSLTMEEYLTAASLELALKAIREDQAIESLGNEKGCRTRQLEIELRRKDSSTVWTETNLTSMRDPDGKLIGHLGVVRDITERKRATEALRKSEERFRSLVETTSDWIWEVGANGTYIYASPKVRDILGYEPREVIGKTPFDFMSPEEAKRVAEESAAIVKNSRPFSTLENINLRKDGQVVVLESSGVPILDAEGKLCGYRGIARDITRRKHVEKALQEREAEYRLLVENANEAIIVACDGMLCFVNPKTTEIMGYSREELTSRPFVNFIHPDDREMVAERHVRRLRGEQFPGVYPFRIIDKGGNTKWLEISAVLISWGNRPATLNFLTNITKRKQALDELRTSYEQLRNLYRRLQSVREEERISIAREVHDELGQALIALKMDISWLEGRLRPTDETLLEKARAMSGVIDNTIKAVKRISTTLRPLVLDDLGLVAAVQWEAGEFQKRTGIKCKLDLDCRGELAADAELSTGIFRILQEALTNITRHANATRVKVSLLEKDGELLLKVSDNGRGIGEDHISSPKSFGLIGIRERASALEGEAKILGIPGKGTVLTVAVPMIRGMKSHDKNTGG